MRKNIFFIVSAVLFLAAFYSFSFASNHFVYPVPELGNCADKEACGAYCNEPENGSTCLEYGIKMGTIGEETAKKLKESLPTGGPGGCHTDKLCRVYCADSSHAEECTRYAEEHNLLPPQELQRAKEFVEITGPGGCKGAGECRAYCDDEGHKEECLQFAERKGLISGNEARAAQQVLQQGGPGGCRSSNECKSYCEDSAHIEECLAFGEKHGFVSPEQARLIKKSGLVGGPGGCKGDQCRAYCGDPAHQEECVAFAESNGLISKEEAEHAKKIAGKPGPGGCRGDACRAYCEDQTHVAECLQFAEENGFLPKEELERAKKFVKISQEGGPGGCRGDQCRAYCGDPAHQEECFEFAKNQGIINPEDEKSFEAGRKIRKKMEETGGPGGCKNEDECRSYCTDSSRVEECIAFGAAHGGIPEEEVRKMLSQFQQNRFEGQSQFGHSFRPPEEFRRFEEEGFQRFQEFRQLEEHFRGGAFPGQSFDGPEGIPFGGPEGRPFDEPHREFPSGVGGAPTEGGFVGPGGCASPSECIKYCSEHKEECFSFGPPGEPSRVPPEGGIPPGRGEPRSFQGFPGQQPRLRSGITREIKPDELPSDFHQKSEEERQQFFRQKFEEFQGRSPGDQFPHDERNFPGRPGQFEGSRPFPGRPGEFPGRPEEFRGEPRTFPGQAGSAFPPEGFRSPEGFHPPEGFLHPEFPSQFQNQPIPQEGGVPPPGSFSQPSGEFHPFSPPPSGETFSPPPTGSFESAPPPPPPSSYRLNQFFANIVNGFLGR